MVLDLHCAKVIAYTELVIVIQYLPEPNDCEPVIEQHKYEVREFVSG